MNRLVLLSLLCTSGGAACAHSMPAVAPIPRCGDGPAPTPPKVFDTAPKLLFSPDPEFSEQARRHRKSGTVVVRIHITAKGDVDSAVATCGVGYGLNEKAMDAALQFRFHPALKDGQPVDCILYVDINFQTF